MRNLYALAFLMLAVACSPAAVPTSGSLPPTAAATPQALPGVSQSASPTPGQSSGTGGGAMVVTSAAFAEGGNIPKKYTCDGPSTSPPLKWSGAPAGTASFALIVDDPDAPAGTFTHWVAYDIPSNQAEIQEGAQAVGKAGQNSAGKNGYTGPCPPSGTHRYIFTLYALDVPSLNLSDGAAKNQVVSEMQGHILAQAQLIGRYGR